jgi:hypothetical protein
MKKKYTVVIQHVVKEEVEMEIEADSAMNAYDEVQSIIKIRNSKTNKKFAINKIEVK